MDNQNQTINCNKKCGGRRGRGEGCGGWEGVFNLLARNGWSTSQLQQEEVGDREGRAWEGWLVGLVGKDCEGVDKQYHVGGNSVEFGIIIIVSLFPAHLCDKKR